MSFSMQTPIKAEFDDLIYEEKGDVATITLNRPKVVNALSVKVSDELVAAVEKVRQSESIKILVFRGAGGNFCAGDDLKEFLNLPEWGDSNRAFRRARFYQDMAYSIEELDKITIAAVLNRPWGIGWSPSYQIRNRAAHAVDAHDGTDADLFGARHASDAPTPWLRPGPGRLRRRRRP